MADWTIEYESDGFARFYMSLPDYERSVLVAAVNHVLKVHGIDICAAEWGKALGHGLYEFRVRRSLNALHTLAGLPCAPDPQADRTVLIRVFCTFQGDRIVILYHGYDKKRDPSSKRQQREIAKARKLHAQWKRTRKR